MQHLPYPRWLGRTSTWPSKILKGLINAAGQGSKYKYCDLRLREHIRKAVFMGDSQLVSFLLEHQADPFFVGGNI